LAITTKKLNMPTLAQSLPRSKSSLSWLRDFIKEELAPYPGRGALVARMTVAATLVMIINMVFRIPYGAYGAIYALTISRENPDATLKAVKNIILGFTLSVLYILVGAMFFLQDPNLRLFWVITTLFVMFYALSAAANYTVAARFGYLLVITIPAWDHQIPAKLKVEQTLWAFGALALASLITIAVELIYAELNRRDGVLQPISERLALVEELLNGYCVGEEPDDNTEKQINHFALLRGSDLRRTLQRSGYSSQYREEIGALVALIGRMMDIVANMVQLRIEVPHDERDPIRSLANNVRNIRSDLLAGKIPRLPLSNESKTLHDVPLFGELQTTVSLIPEAFTGSISLNAYSPPAESPDHSALTLFKADALSNPEHIKFGLRGCLAASLCYLFYNAKAWPEINTAITTCFLTALSTVGSSHQKQVLRIAGAIAGGVGMGIGAEVFILPHLDSIAGFTVIFIAATAISAWFATSSPRLSYFGVQVAVAFYLINLSEFNVQTSLLPARDRVIGILLGLLMMWLVFDQLWGASAIVQMRKAFISNLRLLAQLSREPLSNDLRIAAERSFSLRETINSNFDNVRSFADAVLFEFGPSRARDLALRNLIRRAQPQMRVLFIMQIAEWKYRAQLPGFELPEAIAVEQREFDDRLAESLDSLADRVEGRSTGVQQTLQEARVRLERTIQDYRPERISEGRFDALLLLDRKIESSILSLADVV
jgi:multidrug resistance protein MdtO